jgi:hypothetical protein
MAPFHLLCADTQPTLTYETRFLFQGGATHVDIACDPELVKLACSITKIPVSLQNLESSLKLNECWGTVR